MINASVYRVICAGCKIGPYDSKQKGYYDEITLTTMPWQCF